MSKAGPHSVVSLQKYIDSKAKLREKERLDAGGGDIFFMRTSEDLSAKDGNVIMVEYCEENPPLLSHVGMCTRIKNYHKCREMNDSAATSQFSLGEATYAQSSPFLGSMQSGQSIQALENNMYRSPLYPHKVLLVSFCSYLHHPHYSSFTTYQVDFTTQMVVLSFIPAREKKFQFLIYFIFLHLSVVK